MDMITTLTAIYNTLNQIEVRGRDNIERMFGCLNILTQTIAALKKDAEPAGEDNNSDKE